MVFDPPMVSIAEIGISIKRAGLSPAPGLSKPAHASSGFRPQVSFRAVFSWGCNSYAFIKLSVCRPPYTLSESTFPYKHPRAAPLASMR